MTAGASGPGALRPGDGGEPMSLKPSDLGAPPQPRSACILHLHSQSRLAAVQPPVIPIVGRWTAETPGTISLGQGIVSYGPPPRGHGRRCASFGSALADHRYGPVEGLPELVAAIETKLARENGIVVRPASRVLVTAGGNQAFVNAVLAVTDPGDEVILPAPYYFNHEMAVVIAGAVPVGVPTDREYQLDVDGDCRGDHAADARDRDGLAEQPDRCGLSRRGAARGQRSCAAIAASSTSTTRPTNTSPMRRRGISRPGRIAGAAGHTISLYSLSKALRDGELAGRLHGGARGLWRGVNKIQDTLLICPPAASQRAALAALAVGAAYPAQPPGAAGPTATRDLRGAERCSVPCEVRAGGRGVLLPGSRRLHARLDDAGRAPDSRAQSRDDPGLRVRRCRAVLDPHLVRRARTTRGQPRGSAAGRRVAGAAPDTWRRVSRKSPELQRAARCTHVGSRLTPVAPSLDPSLLYLIKKQPILALQRPANLAVGVDDDVFFLRHPHRLAVPLGHRRRRLQLDREPHARDDLGVAASGHAVLIVPESDQRAGAVAVQADRMRVDGAVDALATSSARATSPGSRCRCGPGWISSSTMSCSALALASARFSPAGRVGLARQQHVGVVLRVGVQPGHGDADVAVQQVAALDDRIVAELLRGRALALDCDARLEPGVEAEVVDALPPPPHQIAGPRRARRDHAPTRTSSGSSTRPAPASAGRTLPRRAGATAISSSGSAFGILELRGPFLAERRAHALAARRWSGRRRTRTPWSG